MGLVDTEIEHLKVLSGVHKLIRVSQSDVALQRLEYFSYFLVMEILKGQRGTVAIKSNQF